MVRTTLDSVDVTDAADAPPTRRRRSTVPARSRFVARLDRATNHGQLDAATQITSLVMGYVQQRAKPPVQREGHGHAVHPAPAWKLSQLPPTHTSSTLHSLSQRPQCRGSLEVVTHAPPPVKPPQPVVPDGHAATHAPPAQLDVPNDGHAVPIAPQLSGSESVSVHPPPGVRVNPGRHAQAPDTQYSRSLHAFPIAPQFSGSRERSTQAPPGDATKGAVHLHVPDTHVPDGSQTLPHAPQLPGSLDTSAQPPEHASWPAGQAHAPDVHVAPLGQAIPHPPQ